MNKVSLDDDQFRLLAPIHGPFHINSKEWNRYLKGIDQTVGTVDNELPERTELIRTFNVPYKEAGLTAGGRALTKHVHRDSSEFWGGQIKGGVAAINARANALLDIILDNIGWYNIYYFNPTEDLLEIRNGQGYGLRWMISNNRLTFRGFIEPQMEDGHSVGWRH